MFLKWNFPGGKSGVAGECVQRAILICFRCERFKAFPITLIMVHEKKCYHETFLLALYKILRN